MVQTLRKFEEELDMFKKIANLWETQEQHTIQIVLQEVETFLAANPPGPQAQTVSFLFVVTSPGCFD
jgi:hypothetical protein